MADVRAMFFATVCVATALSGASAQPATVAGRANARETGQPVGYAAISVLPRGEERLASASGAFVLPDLPPGEVRLRLRHIGFAPKDTTFVVGANDTAQVRIEMTRLALALRVADSHPLQPPPPSRSRQSPGSWSSQSLVPRPSAR